jgi:hypothetical protein
MKKSNTKPVTRRNFLKGSVAGAAAFGMAPTLFIPRFAPAFESWEDPHPNVSGLKVVGVHDKDMTTEILAVSPWKKQQELVDAEVVAANMDKLACELTEESEAKDAWKAIFVKPPGKSWSDTVVAIKTNNIARQHTRNAVMSKMCEVLVQRGVKAHNIFIYDACHGKDMLKKTPFEDLPEETNVMSRWGGSTTPTEVPAPWQDGSMKAKCVQSLVAGKVDILVNIALCKGHSTKFGAFTQTMKNHLGTFEPQWAHQDGATEYVLAINKTAEILGELSSEGKVLFPRQQLCLIDALWASEDGPGCMPSVQPNCLFMGTSSPVLDYLVATEFRKGFMGWSIEENVTKRFLTEFGLKHGDLANGGSIINV